MVQRTSPAVAWASPRPQSMREPGGGAQGICPITVPSPDALAQPLPCRALCGDFQPSSHPFQSPSLPAHSLRALKSLSLVAADLLPGRGESVSPQHSSEIMLLNNCLSSPEGLVHGLVHWVAGACVPCLFWTKTRGSKRNKI